MNNDIIVIEINKPDDEQIKEKLEEISCFLSHQWIEN